MVTCPSFHVLSVLSGRNDILQSNVLDVFAKALKSCSHTTRCAPYVPDVQLQDLPRHIEHTKPDFVVLISEYDDFNDLTNLPTIPQQFRDVLSVVKRLEG